MFKEDADKMKFYICSNCRNLVEMIHDSKIPMMCCGQKMEELIPNVSDGAGEKHLPVVTVENGTVHVNVGEVDHPMLAEHSIQWVCIETEKGCQRKYLNPGEKPNVTFCIGDDKLVAVYEYCNIHGLWKTEV